VLGEKPLEKRHCIDQRRSSAPDDENARSPDCVRLGLNALGTTVLKMGDTD